MDTLYRWSKFVPEDRLEEWEHRLLAAGIPFAVEKQVKRSRWCLSVYTSTFDEADVLRVRFGGSVAPVSPDSWLPGKPVVEEAPLRIRDSLIITSSEDPAVIARLESEHPTRIVLSFPRQLAFGTGSHPTTAGCLRYLVDIARRFSGRPWTMLDLGCGSGILAIAAAKLGARAVVAIDNDGMALEYARENGLRHGVGDRVDFREGDVVELLREKAPVYDLIAANLFSDLLVEVLPHFPARLASQGETILSGFLATQAEIVSGSAQAAGLPLTELSRRGKWMAARISRPTI